MIEIIDTPNCYMDMVKEMWEERYSGEAYTYGTEPNHFFKDSLEGLPPGRLLLPADGEGRNGVFAATRGWDVQAVDFSNNARRKAIELANRHQVHIHYTVSDIFTFPYPHERFDAIALIFVHMAAGKRKKLHTLIANALKPGGTLILEAFSKQQLRYASGGPRDENLLFSSVDLKSDFNEMDITLLSDEEAFLSEGSFHQGKAAVIRMIAVKRPT